jgi:uncharacterized protein
MKLGIISDTHDNLETIEKAFALFEQNAVELIFHCGDWTLPSTVTYTGNLSEQTGISVKAVLGNRDEAYNLIYMANNKLPHPIEFAKSAILKIEIEGKSIAMYHGHDKKTLAELVSSQRYDCIFTGHTHKAVIEKIGKTTLLNPGSTAFTIPRQKDMTLTIGLFDTESSTAQLVNINTGEILH